ncbi:lysophospholipid acyltransferase family protein [Tenacibaculum sp. SSH1-16]|uniref:lysophospholipid acyltransferase family protein n=1 Tax=Tenacibaculum sp. SSH1-16 TaxID=3136667 RepID=UPI0032C47FBD
MKYIYFPIRFIWRVWFYTLIVVSILIMLPFLLVLTSDEKYYPAFWKMVRVWAFFLIYGMGFRLNIEREQEINCNESYMFCSNHASFIDPWVLIAMSKNPIVFVGKKELAKFPIFGFFYKKVVIVVDRSDLESRKKVYEEAHKRLKNGTSIAIFPEGLVPTEDVVLAPFKNGAFSLAIEHQIPIVPQVYYDGKRLFSWDFFKGSPGLLRVKQCKFIETKNLITQDKNKLREQTYNIIYNELINDELYMKDTNRSIHERKFK